MRITLTGRYFKTLLINEIKCKFPTIIRKIIRQLFYDTLEFINIFITGILQNGLSYYRWGVRKTISGRPVGSPFLWCDIMCWFHPVATSVTSSGSNSMKQNFRQSTWTGSDGSDNSRSTKSWRRGFSQQSQSF